MGIDEVPAHGKLYLGKTRAAYNLAAYKPWTYLQTRRR